MLCYSHAVSLLFWTEESSLLMYLSSISSAMSGRLMSDDLRASTSWDQVGLGEDWSHSLSIVVKRPPGVCLSFWIACRVNSSLTLYNFSDWYILRHVFINSSDPLIMRCVIGHFAVADAGFQKGGVEEKSASRNFSHAPSTSNHRAHAHTNAASQKFFDKFTCC